MFSGMTWSQDYVIAETCPHFITFHRLHQPACLHSCLPYSTIQLEPTWCRPSISLQHLSLLLLSLPLLCHTLPLPLLPPVPCTLLSQSLFNLKPDRCCPCYYGAVRSDLGCCLAITFKSRAKSGTLRAIGQETACSCRCPMARGSPLKCWGTLPTKSRRPTTHRKSLECAETPPSLFMSPNRPVQLSRQLHFLQKTLLQLAWYSKDFLFSHKPH